MTDRAASMPASNLAQAQARIGAALRSFDARAASHAPTLAAAVALLDGAAERNARRLAIYRANAIVNATNALRAHYPVIERVVGAEFFAGLARAYCARQPSLCGDLGAYGDALAEFVASDARTQTLPYLPDLARLEWAVHLAEIAADAAPERVPREPAVLWAPGTQVLASAHPIADLWLAHQDDAGFEPGAIAWRAQGALVYRDGWTVRVAALDAQEAQALIDALAKEPS